MVGNLVYGEMAVVSEAKREQSELQGKAGSGNCPQESPRYQLAQGGKQVG